MRNEEASSNLQVPKMSKDPFLQVAPLPVDKEEYDREAGPRSWTPVSLRASFLLSTSLMSFGLVAVLQVLLLRSQRDDGLIFASTIAELPLSRSFAYLYLPTSIAVIYGLLWSWIDLDARRLEPYRQMSKPGGVKVEDSLLLRYPFDFLAAVPINALRRRHWPSTLR